MELNLETLGITKEELTNRVVQQIAAQCLRSSMSDEDGNETYVSSELKLTLDKAVRDAINAKVAEVAEKHVFPIVQNLVENVTLQQTNTWGEKTGSPLTFIEYLVHRAEVYLTEKVDFHGKDKTEANSYSWVGKQARVTYLVNQHLQYSIENAMKKAISEANKVIVGGIEQTVKMKLAEISDKLKVKVET